MAYPTWQPGTLYQPGDIVVPITMPAPSSSVVTNGDFSAGAGGWDYTGGAVYVLDGHGWGGAGCVRLPGNVASGLALNQSVFVVPVGKQITASCMIEQGASTVGATRGWVEVHWYAPDGTALGAPDKGNEINDGRGGAWNKSTVTATCPAGAAYCRAGIALWSVADHNYAIWGDVLQVSGTFAGLPSGLAYRAVQTESGFSDASEPAWPPILGQSVVDNEVTWEAISATRVIWTAEPLYVSGTTEPDWPSGVGEYVLDGSVVFRAVSRRVEDENCPNTKIVTIAASKVFCADNDIVRYSATVNPLDWSTSDDAGYLPTGLQNYGANPVEAMGLYRGNLIVFNAEAFQLWQVDEDPASMALLDALPMGSTQSQAIAPVSNDLFFLASQGVRTVGIAASSTNFQAGDVGMPIDALIKAQMQSDAQALGLYHPAMGQYWLAFPAVSAPQMGPTITGVAPDGQTLSTYQYGYTVTPGDSPIQHTVIAAGSLPVGLTLNEAEAVISGVPSAAGIARFKLRIVDVDGLWSELEDEIEVRDFDPVTSPQRYLLIELTDSTDYSDPSLDDSAWAIGTLPLGTGPYPDATNYGFPVEPAIEWPLDKNAWFRGKFNLDVATDMELAVYLDDAAEVFINGTSVFDHATHDAGGTDYYWVETVPASRFVVGVNSVAIKARGNIYFVNNYVCYRLTPV